MITVCCEFCDDQGKVLRDFTGSVSFEDSDDRSTIQPGETKDFTLICDRVPPKGSKSIKVRAVGYLYNSISD